METEPNFEVKCNKVKVTLRLTVSQSVSQSVSPGVEPSSGAHNQILITV
jgi:hypothetical protein